MHFKDRVGLAMLHKRLYTFKKQLGCQKRVLRMTSHWHEIDSYRRLVFSHTAYIIQWTGRIAQISFLSCLILNILKVQV